MRSGDSLKPFFRRLGVLSRIPKFCMESVFSKGELRTWYVSEGQDWVIRDIGETLVSELAREGFSLTTTTSTRFLSRSLIHYGSLHMFLNSPPATTPGRNRVMTTFYHGREGLEPALDRSIAEFRKRKTELEHLVVSNSLVHQRVLDWGMDPARVTRIPIGFHSERFSPASIQKKAQIRARLGIPKDIFCIGSFQKDSEGWGEGKTPKLVKGPDVFAELLGRLKKQTPVMALLTGPARGYLKSRLNELGVPFVHEYVADPKTLGDYYRALDAYVISSREEGGPIAIMESLQSGIPLVTTRMGMAVDVVRDGENAWMVDVDDIDALEAAVLRLIKDPNLGQKMRETGPPSVHHLSWRNVATQYGTLYRKLLAQS